MAGMACPSLPFFCLHGIRFHSCVSSLEAQRGRLLPQPSPCLWLTVPCYIYPPSSFRASPQPILLWHVIFPLFLAPSPSLFSCSSPRSHTPSFYPRVLGVYLVSACSLLPHFVPLSARACISPLAACEPWLGYFLAATTFQWKRQDSSSFKLFTTLLPSSPLK